MRTLLASVPAPLLLFTMEELQVWLCSVYNMSGRPRVDDCMGRTLCATGVRV